jgi:hypothetical protein
VLVLYGDLLLLSTGVMVEPLSQQHHRSRRLVSKLKVFSSVQRKTPVAADPTAA